MDRKLKRWELSLLLGVVCALLLGGWLRQEQDDLADSLLRLHILANSDSAEDQALKAAVRDRVLEEAQTLWPQDATLEEAKQAVSNHLDDLARAGQSVVDAHGYDYPVSASLETCWFPTREYQNFSLPAGNYQALRVVIGRGEGRNWWCVAFPPLCLGAASETLEQAAQTGCFTPEQTALLSGEPDGYVLKFKAMELLGQLEGLLEGCTK